MENTFVLLIYLIGLFGIFGILSFIAEVLEKKEGSKVVIDKLLVLPKQPASKGAHLNAVNPQLTVGVIKCN